jgi:hypothetical protein
MMKGAFDPIKAFAPMANLILGYGQRRVSQCIGAPSQFIA